MRWQHLRQCRKPLSIDAVAPKSNLRQARTLERLAYATLGIEKVVSMHTHAIEAIIAQLRARHASCSRVREELTLYLSAFMMPPQTRTFE